MEKYGFVYIWRDKKRNRYYIGCHWGTETDGYICSSNWMRSAYRTRPQDFKRRILARVHDRKEMYSIEAQWLSLIKASEIKERYYNLHNHHQNLWHSDPNYGKTIGQKISAAKKGKPIVFKDPLGRAQRISEGKKAAFAVKPYPKKDKPIIPTKVIREKPVTLCKICEAPTLNRRSNFCSKEHRYQAMNATRKSIPGTKWCPA